MAGSSLRGWPHGTLLLLTALMLLCACRRPAASSAPPAVDSTDTRARSLMDHLADDDDLAALHRALEATGLSARLRTGTPHTLFAPTDAALRAPGPDSLFADSLLTDTLDTGALRDTLRTVLSYHIVRGRVPPGDVSSDSLRMSTLANEPLTLARAREAGALRAGGRDTVRVLRSVEAQNGVLHVVPSLLRPPVPDTTRGAALRETPQP